ncbi:MAG: glutamate-5-semialdehyde dehydrogenase [Candidatus Altiarchaeota archaeon]
MKVEDKARKAYAASILLANASAEDKNKALEAVAKAVNTKRAEILAANEKDVAGAEKLCERGSLSKALVERLKLTDKKIDGIVASVISVAHLDDPVGRVLSKTELDAGLILTKKTVPIGVIGTVFESRPDVVPQIASLALKSGNAVIMKGGSEALSTNKVLYGIIRDASEAADDIPDGWLQFIETRGDVSELLGLDEFVSLVIPRGSNAFVRHVMDNTRIPVLGHADGICHVFVDRDADLSMAEEICFDAKTQYPAVCNAMETMLVDEAVAENFLPGMCERFKAAGVELRGDDKTRGIVSGIKHASDADWVTEYNDLILSVKVVSGVDEAIEHVNMYGSHHTDAIVTGNKETAERFLDFVDSGCVFHNCSTRFSDGFRFGLGAEVGISTNKIHARGPVGLEGLVIYKWLLSGSGQPVKEYAEGKRDFTHKAL